MSKESVFYTGLALGLLLGITFGIVVGVCLTALSMMSAEVLIVLLWVAVMLFLVVLLQIAVLEDEFAKDA